MTKKHFIALADAIRDYNESRVIGKRHTPSQNDAPEYYSEPAQAQHSAEQTSVKLHDALIGEERLAEVAQRLAYAVSDLINEPRTIEIEHYAETALQDYEKARAQ